MKHILITKYFQKIFLYAFLSLLLCFSARAGGSSYSRYGFGDILRYGDGRIYSMGGTGIALLDNGGINLLNPAGIAAISVSRFSSGFEYSNYLSKDESGSSTYSTGKFQGLALAIPISPENGIVMLIDGTPYSDVSYAISSSIYDPLSSTTQHQIFYGSGGLSYLGLGLSVSPFNTLHIGGRFNYMYGKTRQYQTSKFENSDYSTTTFDRSIYYSGFTFTLGAIYTGFDQALNLPSLHNLSLGFVLRTAGSLDADAERSYSNDTTIEKGTAKLPVSIGLGLSYIHDNKYRFLGDMVFENWGDLKPFALDPVTLRNSYRASLGFEIIPDKGAATFFKKIFYRAGFSYNSTYYQVNGTGINEYCVTGGIGVPIGIESWLNIGMQVGMRGTTDFGLQKDTIVRLSFSVSASELWFLKFEEE